jgi:hypothetical protein
MGRPLPKIEIIYHIMLVMLRIYTKSILVNEIRCYDAENGTLTIMPLDAWNGHRMGSVSLVHYCDEPVPLLCGIEDTRTHIYAYGEVDPRYRSARGDQHHYTQPYGFAIQTNRGILCTRDRADPTGLCRLLASHVTQLEDWRPAANWHTRELSLSVYDKSTQILTVTGESIESIDMDMDIIGSHAAIGNAIYAISRKGEIITADTRIGHTGNIRHKINIVYDLPYFVRCNAIRIRPIGENIIAIAAIVDNHNNSHDMYASLYDTRWPTAIAAVYPSILCMSDATLISGFTI